MTASIQISLNSPSGTTNLEYGTSKFANQNSISTGPGLWTVVSPVSHQATLVFDAKLGINIKSRLARLEKNPARAEGLKKARQRLGRALHTADESKQHSLTSMRLNAGLSQEKLADLMGMQQPNIARMEKNPGDMLATTVLKLAKALNVEPMDVLQLIQSKVERETHNVK